MDGWSFIAFVLLLVLTAWSMVDARSLLRENSELRRELHDSLRRCLDQELLLLRATAHIGNGSVADRDQWVAALRDNGYLGSGDEDDDPDDDGYSGSFGGIFDIFDQEDESREQ